MSWKDFLFPVTELVFVVLIYFLLRRYTPVFTGKIKEIFSVHEERIISLRESIIKLLDISVFSFQENPLIYFCLTQASVLSFQVCPQG